MRRSVLALTVLLAASAARALTPVCYPTPADAASRSASGATDTRSGFRVESRRFDPMLARYWVVVRDCEHPERPALTIATSDVGPSLQETQIVATVRTPTVVRAGSLVRVVSNSANLRLETPAYAQASGAVGDRIRVRVVRLSTAAGQPAVELTATVRGPDYLELE